MGLLNVGVNEGTQIIQLFGRGVRLQGYGKGFRRRAFVADAPDCVEADVVERLNVFGMGAKFMANFREYLQRERRDSEQVAVVFPTIENLDGAKLKIIEAATQGDFKRDVVVDLPVPGSAAAPEPVQLDWRARVGVLAGGEDAAAAAVRVRRILIPRHFKMFFNKREMYDELQDYKSARGLVNLNLPREVVGQLLADDDWYDLMAAPADVEFSSIADARRWQHVAVLLMQKYVQACYARAQNAWEKERRRYRELTTTHPNFVREYRALVNSSQKELVANMELLSTHLRRVKEARARGEKGRDAEIIWPGTHALGVEAFEQHLYLPLFYVGENSALVVQPGAALLDADEWAFVKALKAYYRQNADGFFVRRRLYLLRNMTRGKGVGFFEANNFYPDFLMWVVDAESGLQHVAFVDPKGLRQHRRGSPKLQFYRTIKTIEGELQEDDPDMRLHAFIVTRTRPRDLLWDPEPGEAELEAMNIYRADKEGYVEAIFAKMMA